MAGTKCGSNDNISSIYIAFALVYFFIHLKFEREVKTAPFAKLDAQKTMDEGEINLSSKA